jgi:hypothetical protein
MVAGARETASESHSRMRFCRAPRASRAAWGSADGALDTCFPRSSRMRVTHRGCHRICTGKMAVGSLFVRSETGRSSTSKNGATRFFWHRMIYGILINFIDI